jgi:hypothetical protein
MVLGVSEFVMAPRAYWKGYLKLSLVSCPIALLPATSKREKISFHQLNKKTGHRIKYRKVDAESGDEVDSAFSYGSNRPLQGRSERYADIAAEFVRLEVDVIVTVGNAVPIVRQATAVIPIVFAVGIDPVGSGFVASLARPGGHVTGFATLEGSLGGKIDPSTDRPLRALQ